MLGAFCRHARSVRAKLGLGMLGLCVRRELMRNALSSIGIPMVGSIGVLDCCVCVHQSIRVARRHGVALDGCAVGEPLECVGGCEACV
jgi:hypothetical protein